VFDHNADPAVVISEIYRECYRRAVERIRSRQLGEAFRDLPQPQPEPLREAA
jgi:hypothetical protein